MSFLTQTWAKIVLAVLSSGIFLVVLFTVACWGLFSWSDRQALAEWNATKRLPFDQKVWLAEPESHSPDPMRLRMVDDLLAHQDFKGRSRQNVESLLGPATRTDKFRNWDRIYWLGPNRGSFRIDSEWLVFRFDAQGRVIACQLLSD